MCLLLCKLDVHLIPCGGRQAARGRRGKEAAWLGCHLYRLDSSLLSLPFGLLGDPPHLLSSSSFPFLSPPLVAGEQRLLVQDSICSCSFLLLLLCCSCRTAQICLPFFLGRFSCLTRFLCAVPSFLIQFFLLLCCCVCFLRGVGKIAARCRTGSRRLHSAAALSVPRSADWRGVLLETGSPDLAVPGVLRSPSLMRLSHCESYCAAPLCYIPCLPKSKDAGSDAVSAAPCSVGIAAAAAAATEDKPPAVQKIEVVSAEAATAAAEKNDEDKKDEDGEKTAMAAVAAAPPKSNLKKANCADGVCAAKGNVKWLDLLGKDLTEVKEFEPSESGDSLDDGDGISACVCVIQ